MVQFEQCKQQLADAETMPSHCATNVYLPDTPLYSWPVLFVVTRLCKQAIIGSQCNQIMGLPGTYTRAHNVIRSWSAGYLY